MKLDECYASALSYAEPQRAILEKPIDGLEDAYQFLNAFENILVLGTGGSSLGGQALTAIAPNSKKCIFAPNIDPRSFEATINELDSKTGVLIISKSGKTTETLMQVKCLSLLWPNFEHRACVITDPASDKTQNTLREWAKEKNIRCYNHPPVGGRFSVFSIVGCLPAKLAGLNVEAFRKAALGVFDLFTQTKPNQAASLISAYQNAEWMKQGLTTHIAWIYGDGLLPWGNWYAQLWGESLGKKNHSTRFGSTPVVARGTVDQHSQLQLYLDGPKDKWLTFYTIDHQIEEEHALSAHKLAAHKLSAMGKLMNIHQKATIETLRSNDLPVRQIHINSITETTLGELMAHSMLEIWGTAALLGIDPLDQPAVEQVKVRVHNDMQHMPEADYRILAAS